MNAAAANAQQQQRSVCPYPRPEYLVQLSQGQRLCATHRPLLEAWVCRSVASAVLALVKPAGTLPPAD